MFLANCFSIKTNIHTCLFSINANAERLTFWCTPFFRVSSRTTRVMPSRRRGFHISVSDPMPKTLLRSRYLPPNFLPFISKNHSSCLDVPAFHILHQQGVTIHTVTTADGDYCWMHELFPTLPRLSSHSSCKNNIVKNTVQMVSSSLLSLIQGHKLTPRRPVAVTVVLRPSAAG